MLKALWMVILTQLPRWTRDLQDQDRKNTIHPILNNINLEDEIHHKILKLTKINANSISINTLATEKRILMIRDQRETVLSFKNRRVLKDILQKPRLDTHSIS